MITPNVAAIVLAAGKGTRMKSKMPKVLHKVAGREMILHVLDSVSCLEPTHLITILGHESEMVESCIQGHFDGAKIVLQTEQLGTGHAVLQAESALKDFEGDVIILCGDVPLVDENLVTHLMASHAAQENDLTFVTTFVEDPTGMGRILRDEKEDVSAIIEHKDASATQRQIDEVNAGIYVCKSPLLFELLNQVTSDNTQKEYYLPDIIAIALRHGHSVGTYTAENGDELSGVNSRLQLSYAEDLFQNRLREEMMENGVTLLDPQSVFFAWDTKIGKDTILGPNIRFGERVRLESNIEVEGNLFITNSYVNESSTLKSFCHIDGAIIGEGSTIGPFAKIRPETETGKNVKIGSFVETKKAKFGEKTSVAHLSYMGDVTVGEHVNIGGGTILANYNHNTKEKFNTVIEDHVALGVNNSIVAPCTLHENAVTGAGAIIRKDVPARALAILEAPQKIKKNYIKK